MQKLSLTELGNKYGTDKAAAGQCHMFTEFYEKYTSPLREDKINLLEIGILEGSSLRMWKEYFTNGNIYAFDIEDKSAYRENRIIIDQANQTDYNRQREIFPDVSFDIIVDDGGHFMEQQETSLIALFDRVKPGGLYILEDLHTSFMSAYIQYTTKPTAYQLIESFANKTESFINHYVPEQELKNVASQIEFVDIYNHANAHITSVIKKKA